MFAVGMDCDRRDFVPVTVQRFPSAVDDSPQIIVLPVAEIPATLFQHPIGLDHIILFEGHSCSVQLPTIEQRFRIKIGNDVNVC